MRTWVTLRSFPLSIRLLVVNQFGVNVGFYLLLPYLAGYLADDVGLSAAVIGIVLGVRNLSQQGMFLLGGSAADRIGARGVIIAGCALRAVGFGLFAISTSLLFLLAASILSGLAGALFNPAVRTYVAQAAADRRAEAFALFNVFASAGALLGPLLGSALLVVDFRVAALAAAAVFAALTVAQAIWLPAQPVEPSAATVWQDWRTGIADRRFLAFSVALAGMFALQTQLYLILPMQAEHVTGQPVAVAVLFVVSTVVTLALQLPLTGWLQGRWSRGTSITAGMAVMGAGFLLPLLRVESAPPVLRMVPVLAAAVLLTVGVMIAQPFVLELIPAFAGRGLTGTYFGLFYLVSGILAAGCTAAVGAAVGASADAGVPGSAWLLTAGVGMASAGAVWLLRRGGLLTPASAPVSVS
ncbi:MFS transporter [Micromonospora endophytica]|uniref:MFS transporter n=1 Tax=Micromonospora endophytica TaxID=515350 RepID=A0A2W2DK42_9ACTN|nr:MFS transporter [Micromonospora endophytica]PZG01180.1 MFS transporter [Micromonospora endophytica]RIW42145.1 MFS transporter [Micromonospora endophytica]BCJ61849.1 putative ABC transporter, permease protein [Micromonospora endophytica]